MRGAENKKKRSRRGWVPFGYKYLGPGNDLDRGEPTMHSDRMAQKHDWFYKFHEMEGINPKYNWVTEDDDFLEDIKNEKDWGARVAAAIFRGKKRLAQWGLLDKQPPAKWQKTQSENDWNVWNKASFNKKLEEADNTFHITWSKHQPTDQLSDFNLGIPSQMTSQAKGEGGSGNGQGLKETQIDDVFHVMRGPPPYTFASLPFQRDLVQKVASGVDRYHDSQVYRMTSPYDCRVNMTVTDTNVGAGTLNVAVASLDSADSTQQAARWFNYYAGLYDYYHVIGCRWHFTIENLGTEPLWIHEMYGNEEQPPVLADNMDIRMWTGVKSHYLGTHSVAVTTTGEIKREDIKDGTQEADNAMSGTTNVANFETGNMLTSKGVAPILKLSGQYETGDFNQLIHLDSLVENWTAVTANPALSERLNLIIKPQWEGQELNSANDVNTVIAYRSIFEAEYLVEFKQLKTGLRYPVQKQPITVTINNTTTSQ